MTSELPSGTAGMTSTTPREYYIRAQQALHAIIHEKPELKRGPDGGTNHDFGSYRDSWSEATSRKRRNLVPNLVPT